MRNFCNVCAGDSISKVEARECVHGWTSNHFAYQWGSPNPSTFQKKPDFDDLKKLIKNLHNSLWPQNFRRSTVGKTTSCKLQDVLIPYQEERKGMSMKHVDRNGLNWAKIWSKNGQTWLKTLGQFWHYCSFAPKCTQSAPNVHPKCTQTAHTAHPKRN